MKVKLLSCAPLLATPWTAAYQAPPSKGFSRQEYWSGVPLPSLNCASMGEVRDVEEIQPVYSKGDQPWVFFGRTDAKAATPVLWPPHAKS